MRTFLFRNGFLITFPDPPSILQHHVIFQVHAFHPGISFRTRPCGIPASRGRKGERNPDYRIDRNPNSIEPRRISISLPLDPEMAPAPSCVPMGMIGVALDGVPFYNALDGFGIYSSRDGKGRELTDTDLDECHGRTSPVEWNGKVVNIYHYVLTKEYPYTIGCFRGKPVPTGMRRPGRHPPEEAVHACEALSEDSECSFETPRGNRISGRCRSPGGTLVCVPLRR